MDLSEIAKFPHTIEVRVHDTKEMMNLIKFVEEYGSVPRTRPKKEKPANPEKASPDKAPGPHVKGVYKQPLPVELVDNFKKQIMAELENGSRTVTELAEKIYGSEVTTESPEWMKVYRVLSKLRKESLVDKRPSSRGIEWFLEGGSPSEEAS